MEITSFVLGMLSVVFLLGIILGVFGARKITKLEEKTNSLIREIEECHRHINQVSELDNRRIDGEVDRVDELVNNVYRDIDSRLDKLENKLTGNIATKQSLKG